MILSGTLQARLMRFAMATVTVASVLIAMLLTVGAMIKGQDSLNEDVAALMLISGEALRPYLDFGDPAGAETHLKAMLLHPHILAARLSDKQGTVLAQAERVAGAARPIAVPIGSHPGLLFRLSINLSHTIGATDESIGTLELHIDLRPLWTELLQHTALIALATLLALVAAYAVAQRLKRQIVAPIRAIDAVARQISTSRRYDLRIERITDDELGELTDTLNRMLAEIESADKVQRQAASVFKYANESIIITAPDGTILDVNEGFTHQTGYNREEALNQNPRMLKSDRQDSAFYAQLWATLKADGNWTGEIWNRKKSGELYVQRLTISAVHSEQGELLRYVGLAYDITAIKEHEHQLERMANYDALTGLPNRTLLADRLHQGMSQAERTGQLLAVAFLDLDGFKAINDNHSHDVGDKLLKAIAARMKAALRDIDTLARLGGDEFVAVILDMPSHESCAPVLERLLEAASAAVRFDGLELYVSASVGVAFYPQVDAIDADQLMRQADQAMYAAKQSGKNRYYLFDAEHERAVRGQHESVESIRQALHDRQFVLYYQPKVNMKSGALIGAEALIRWQHPQRGLLPPGAFLPSIEGHPVMVELGEWVLSTALEQIVAWRLQGLHIPISVNIDAQQLGDAEFVEKLRTLLAEHPLIGPGDLELEVLETSALDDIERVSAIMRECRSIGIKVSLADFGTGDSSLRYLKQLPADLMKIDQGFVRDMLEDPEDLMILEGVLGLASSFQREAIAEGVETLPHGCMLLRMGCELGQGYAIARPMPAKDIPAWQADWRPDTTWTNTQRIDRSFMPILFAQVEHRAWIIALNNHLFKKTRQPEPNEHQCAFGKWLDSDAQVLSGASRENITQLHDTIHRQAAELVDLNNRGFDSLAQSRFREIEVLRDQLIDSLDACLDK